MYDVPFEQTPKNRSDGDFGVKRGGVHFVTSLSVCTFPFLPFLLLFELVLFYLSPLKLMLLILLDYFFQ